MSGRKKKGWDQKETTQKKTHFNETCLEQFEGTEKIVKYRLRLCWVNSAKNKDC